MSGRHTSIRAIPSEEQRLTPGGDTNAQFTIRASRIRRFCVLSFLLTKKIPRKYVAVSFGRSRRRPISSKRAKSCILFVRFLLSTGSRYAAGEVASFSDSAYALLSGTTSQRRGHPESESGRDTSSTMEKFAKLPSSSDPYTERDPSNPRKAAWGRGIAEA